MFCLFLFFFKYIVISLSVLARFLYWCFPTLMPLHSFSALSLFLMAVNIKTPVVVENITLMCLRILQKLIKPPAPTSKKNKVQQTHSIDDVLIDTFRCTYLICTL